MYLNLQYFFDSKERGQRARNRDLGRGPHRARICKRLYSRSQDSIPPFYVALRARTTNRVVVPARHAGNRFLDSLNGLQMRAQTSVGGQQNAPFKRGQIIIFNNGNTPVWS